MAQAAGTTDTYRIGSAGGNREDLEDTIWDLFADETYCLSNFPKLSASASYHEWLLDTLASPTTNRMIEGDEFSYSTVAAPTRVGNYVQTLSKQWKISRIQDSVSKAGRKTEMARQQMKKMREWKNEAEYAIVRNQASSAGGSSTARSMASLESWIATNEILATTTASATTPGFSSGTVAAPTDGSTTGAFTESAFKSALKAAWEQGGDANTVLVGSDRKNDIDGFAGIATRQVDVGRSSVASIIGAVDLYVSSYGRHKIILHRHVRSSVVLCLDPEYWGIAFIDRPFMETPAKTGDANNRVILGDMTLVSRNEKASAKVVACA